MTYVSGWATDLAAQVTPAPTPARRPRYRPGAAKIGDPTPQSHPDMFADADLRAEFRHLARLNARYGVHPLRVGAQNALIRSLRDRGAELPIGYVAPGVAADTPAPSRPPARRGRPGGQLYWRGCSGCNTSLASYDGTSENVWCAKCQPRYVTPHAEWAAALAVGSRVYLQPYAAWRGLSHSEYLVTDRDGDMLTVQLVGVPESSMRVTVAQCGQHDLTPRI